MINQTCGEGMRFRRVCTAAVVAFVLASCASGDGESEGVSTEMPDVSAAFVDSVYVEPDYARYTEDGLTCSSPDAPRPCFQPIRIAPELLQDNYVNIVTDDGVYDEWPQESFGDIQGDKMEVVCQIQGPEVSEHPVHGRKSSIWNVIKVHRERLNEWALYGARPEQDPNFGVEMDESGEVQYIYGFAPDIWREQPGVISQLRECTAAQNPAGYPPVK